MPWFADELYVNYYLGAEQYDKAFEYETNFRELTLVILKCHEPESRAIKDDAETLLPL